MCEELDECVRKKVTWLSLPSPFKKLLENSPHKYEQYVYEFSVKNQLRFRGNLVKSYRKDEKKYYEALVQSSIKRLMIFPYHLADMIVKGLRITPFIYYIEVVAVLIENEKSYDTMPNFTAADCLRLIGIGRNEYLDLVSKSRSLGKKGRGRAIRNLLPKVPLDIPILPWWRVELGYVLEDDIKLLTDEEIVMIDMLIDCGSQTAGNMNYHVIKSLYRHGLIYLDVPITTEDRVSVPPLKGFVMNRTAGDYFETLLYRIFVSIDEHTTMMELANMLQVECDLVKQAVSLYCRLGFAKKLTPTPVSSIHGSWEHANTEYNPPPYKQISPLTFGPLSSSEEHLQMESVIMKEDESEFRIKYEERDGSCSRNSNDGGKRIGFLFDATLPAYLMMGNLSPDLKSHAVTLFEVGKLCDESLDGLLQELDKVGGWLEGEAGRYTSCAVCARCAVRILRSGPAPIDLLRGEALKSLPTSSLYKLLSSKYRVIISMAPLSNDASINTSDIAILGPPIPESLTPWMKLYIYHIAGYGPPTLFLTKECTSRNLRGVPRPLLGYTWVSTSGMNNTSDIENDAGPVRGALSAARNARGPVIMQARAVRNKPKYLHLVLPPPDPARRPLTLTEREEYKLWMSHAGLRRLARRLRLSRCSGYVTLADLGIPDFGCNDPPENVQLVVTRKRKSHCGIAKPLSAETLKSNESTKSTENQIHTPIESHFAVTPCSESKNSSPSNGFTSADCSDLLKEELDKISQNEGNPLNSLAKELEAVKLYELSKSPYSGSDISLKNSMSIESLSSNKRLDLLSPAEESVSVFNLEEKDVGESVEDGSEEICKPEQWTILDVQFGVPLFDEQLCERVCRGIVERLLTDDNLEQLKKDNEFRREDLLRFIKQCQYTPDEMFQIKKDNIEREPRRNLVFENGRVREWNGK